MSQVETDDLKKVGWLLGKELGSGHFAKVKLVTRESDGVTAACKIIKKPKDSKKREAAEKEYKILTAIDHPYVCKCYEAFETDDKIYLMLELMEGGELFDRIVDMGHFTEEMAADVTYKLLGALKYMHDKKIAHRDLKPENMLMTGKGPDAQVKITDFGLSKFFDEQSSLMKTPCGTPGYIAPEVLNMKGYNEKCDVWSFGVIVYILLCGFPPFYADNDAQLFEKIKKGQYQFLKPYWDPISEEAKACVARMLTVDAGKRPSCEELMEDPWLASAKAKAEAAEQATAALAAGVGGVNILNKTEMVKASANLKKLKGVFLATWAIASMSTE